jgi:fructosamine-3-kinase
MDDTKRRQIEDALERRIRSSRALSGGCVGDVALVEFEDGTRAVVKSDSGDSPKLDVEAFMLRYLADHSTLPIPEVLHAAPDLLVMELVEGESRFNIRTEMHAAELLAELHGVSGKYFGLDRDTLIGGLDQPNKPTESWVDFFREHRLLYMARRAQDEGRFDEALLGRIERFAERLNEWLEEPSHPSLQHGDVWTTNVLARGDRIVAFLDPAIYYGHPEIELAFVTLFSTFGDPFFRRYTEIRGVAPGFFDLRRDIYNLYPLLVHVRLFGTGYLTGVENVLRRHGF